MALVDVLIPTYRRKTGLAVVLTSLLDETFQDFDVTISGQTEEDAVYLDSVEIQTLARVLRWRGHRVRLLRHLPRRGLAEQRQFLLEQSHAPYVHFLDDDVLLDPPVMQRMLDVIRTERIGFVGCPTTVLTHLDDVRPHQQGIEVWDGPVRAEPFTPESIPWDRHKINNAANPLHLELQLAADGRTVQCMVAWVGGANIVFDREKLHSVGGFSWWPRLPRDHAGEEVVIQFLLIRKYGGCGILPSGTYHLELPTTVEERGSDAVELFDVLLRRYAADDVAAQAMEPERLESGRA